MSDVASQYSPATWATVLHCSSGWRHRNVRRCPDLFDAKGYGLRGADQGHPHLWVVTMGVQFTTTDRRYQWLNTTLGVVVSAFDERAGHALWQAFVP